MFKVIIAGGRDFSDYPKLKSTLNQLLANKSDVEIVSGMARGADTLGVYYAKENNLPITKFPADWNKFGKGAGYLRNTEMAKYADACVCFWDKKSKGTKHMIDTAKQYNLALRVKIY